MSATAVQYDLRHLLTRAGGQIRGNRGDCPRCRRPRSVSFDESKGVYYCHGQGCDFSGNSLKLARTLGLAQRLAPAEYHELRQACERADQAARALYDRAKRRRSELFDRLHTLNRIELGAHEAGINHSTVWEALALVYRERPLILVELLILEESTAAELIQFLFSNGEARELAIDRVLVRGGLFDRAGRFVEVTV